MITYKEQFDKITRAYIKDELNATDCQACFVGNMLNNTFKWAMLRDIFDHKPFYQNAFDPVYKFYTMEEICDLEKNFMDQKINSCHGDEDNLFVALESTLEMLKKIHESKGEIVDAIPFQKRVLV